MNRRWSRAVMNSTCGTGISPSMWMSSSVRAAAPACSGGRDSEGFPRGRACDGCFTVAPGLGAAPGSAPANDANAATRTHTTRFPLVIGRFPLLPAFSFRAKPRRQAVGIVVRAAPIALEVLGGRGVVQAVELVQDGQVVIGARQ